MDDYTINNVRILHVPAVGTDMRMHNTTRVSMMIGSHGPFSKDFSEGHDSGEAIKGWQQEMVNKIRMLTS